MEVQIVIPNKVPNLGFTSFVVVWSFVAGVVVEAEVSGHFFTKLVSELPRIKFCSCRAMNTVMISSLSVSGFVNASYVCLILKSCSTVNFVIGGGSPGDWFPVFEVIVILS